MREFTTPTLNITIRYRDGTVASDLEFDFVLFTLVSGKTIVEKKVPYEDVIEGVFSIEFTQEETGSLTPGSTAECELNIMAGSNRIGSAIKRIAISKNLHQGVITNDM